MIIDGQVCPSIGQAQRLERTGLGSCQSGSRLEGREIIGGCLRLGGRRDDCPLVAFQDGQ